jgi:type II secretory pathway component PulF
LNLSRFLQTFGTIILLAIGLIIILVFLFSRSSKGNHSLDKFKINSAVLGRIYKKLSALRFSQGLSMMVRSGISFEDAVEMSAPLTENIYVKEKLKQAHTSLVKGSSVVDAFKDTGVFPNLFIQMLGMGFKSGQVEDMLSKLEEVYEMELDRSTEKFTSSIEPGLVIVLSVVVGIILLTVMLPMIQIMSSIG